MNNNNQNNKYKKNQLTNHILPSSTTIINIYMTIINITHLIPKHNINKHVNEILTLDNLFFLKNTLLSYFSIHHPHKTEKYEHITDIYKKH